MIEIYNVQDVHSSSNFLADSMSVVSRLLEVLGHDLDVGGETGGHEGLDVHVLPAQPVGVLARHEGGPGGGTCGLDVVLVQEDPLLGQLLQTGAVDLLVVPRHVIPT